MSELVVENAPSTSVAIFWVGLDVAKLTFDAALHPPLQPGVAPDLASLPVRRFARTPEGARELIDWIDAALAPALSEPDAACEVRVLMEATGHYSLELVAWLLAARPDLRPSIVNPGLISAHARSLGQRNKTDRTDARVIARFGAERSPEPFQPLSPEQAELRELTRERQSVVQERVAVQERAREGSCSPLVQKTWKKRISHLEKIEEQLESAIRELIQNVPRFKADLELLVSIPGVGFLTAATVLAELGDLRAFARARRLSSFVGLSPRQCQSGTSVRGRTRMSKKGNPRVRSILYLAALAAVRSNPHLRRCYHDLVARGKTKMAALGAVMRKLLVLMRALLVSNSPFQADFAACEKTRREEPSLCAFIP
jgi:transposase